MKLVARCRLQIKRNTPHYTGSMRASLALAYNSNQVSFLAILLDISQEPSVITLAVYVGRTPKPYPRRNGKITLSNESYLYVKLIYSIPYLLKHTTH